METIRAELASTLTGRREIGIDMGKSISRTTPGGLGLGFRTGAADGDISSEAIFGTGCEDGVEEDSGVAELRRAVEKRQRTRPEGIERQVKLCTDCYLVLVLQFSVESSREFGVFRIIFWASARDTYSRPISSLVWQCPELRLGLKGVGLT